MNEIIEPDPGPQEEQSPQGESEFSEYAEKDALKARARTALRIRYEAEASAIQKRLGGLEEIRNVLGLSQRKICQLLLVDPSAWSRWTRTDKNKSAAPPHIYRSLQWYLALQDKYPTMDPQFWLQAVTRDSQKLWASDADARIKELELQVSRLLDQGNEFQRTLERERLENMGLKRQTSILRLSFFLLVLTILLSVGFRLWGIRY